MKYLIRVQGYTKIHRETHSDRNDSWDREARILQLISDLVDTETGLCTFLRV